jgi:hypothetical protein
MIFRKTQQHLALATAMMALMAAGISGCDCGSDTADVVAGDVAQTLHDHPCGGVNPLKSPQLASGDILYVDGAFPTNSDQFYDILDASGNVVRNGDTILPPGQNAETTIFLSSPLPPGTYTVKLTNATPGSCDSMYEGTSAPFTVK